MQLRDYQKESIRALWDWFRANPTGAPLLILPTGAGKSLILAEVARLIAAKGKRVLIVAHRKELLQQNFDKLAALMPFGSIGLYSAGLKRKDSDRQVIVAGIQSIHNKAEELGSFSLVLIDEVHLVSPEGEGRYRTLIADLQRINPDTRFCGLTATPYRLGSGVLTESGGLWTGIAHEVKIRVLIAQGYLSPLISKGGLKKPNIKAIAVKGGEYVASDMEQAFNRLDIVESAIDEVIRFGADRKCWMFFASGVKHAERIGEILTRRGISNGVITGDTPPLIRESLLAAFKKGELRAIVGCEVLTTGFDCPQVDLIAVLRATKSTALWVQLCGRGCRIAEGKKNCLVLDYGENAVTHGPIDAIELSYRVNPLTEKTEVALNTQAMKECFECRNIMPLHSSLCPECGAVQPAIYRLNHGVAASDAPMLSQDEPKYIVEVLSASYARHQKEGKPLPTMRCDYSLAEVEGLSLYKVSEWVCFEHEGFAGKKAQKWWYDRGALLSNDSPVTVDEALGRLSEIKNPRKIEIQKDGKFWRVLRVVEFSEEGSAGDMEKAVAEAEAKFFEDEGINL